MPTVFETSEEDPTKRGGRREARRSITWCGRTPRAWFPIDPIKHSHVFGIDEDGNRQAIPSLSRNEPTKSIELATYGAL